MQSGKFMIQGSEKHTCASDKIRKNFEAIKKL